MNKPQIPQTIADEMTARFMVAEAELHEQGAVGSCVFFYSPHTPDIAYVPTDFEDAGHRQTILMVARMVSLAHRADKAIWIAEAWRSAYRVPKGSSGSVDEAFAAVDREKQEPARHDEVVMACVCWRSADQTLELAMQHRSIERDAAGVFAGLRAPVTASADARSWLSTMIMPIDPGPTWQQRAIAHLADINVSPEDFILTPPVRQ